MFPAGFLFVATTFRNQQKTRWLQPIVVALVFLVVCSPQIIVLSRAKGRLTFADTGELAYGVNMSSSGQKLAGLAHVHSVYQPASCMSILLFSSLTDRFTEDSALARSLLLERGHETGVQFTPDGSPRLRQNLTEILGTILQPRYWMCGMMLILFGAAPRESLRAIGRQWFLIVPALLVMAMYAVTFVTFHSPPVAFAPVECIPRGSSPSRPSWKFLCTGYWQLFWLAGWLAARCNHLRNLRAGPPWAW